MPIYKANGKTYNIPDDKVSSFEQSFPDAQLEIYDGEGKKYLIPSSKREAFEDSHDGWSYNKQGIVQPADTAAAPVVTEPVGISDTLPQATNTAVSPTPLKPQGKVTMDDAVQAISDLNQSIGLPAQPENTVQQVADEVTAPPTPLDREKAERQLKRNRAANQLAGENLRQMADAAGEQLENMQGYASRTLGRPESFAPVKGDKVRDPKTGEMVQTWITPYGEVVDDEAKARQLSDEWRDYWENNTVRGRLRRAKERLQRINQLHSEYQQGVVEQYNNEGLMASAARGVTLNAPKPNSGHELDKLLAAARQTEEEIEELERQLERDNGEDIGFWRRAGGEFSDPNNWNSFLALNDQLTMLNDVKPGASELDDLVMQSAYSNQETKSMVAANETARERWGAILGQMAPFMVDIAAGTMLTGGANVFTKLATKGATRAIGKEAIEEMAQMGFKKYAETYGKKGIMRYAGNSIMKATGNQLDEFLIRAPIAVNTVQATGTAADIIGRKQGDIKEGTDGTLQFDNERTWSSAVWQGEMNAITEYWSEKSPNILTLKNASNVAYVAGAKRMSAVLQRASKSELGGFIGAYQRFANKWLGQGDVVSEIVEEYNGQLVRTGLQLDDAYTTIDGERVNLLQVAQWHGDIICGIGISSTLMGAGHGAIGAAVYGNAKHELEMADAQAQSVFSEGQWQQMRSVIDNTDNGNIGALTGMVLADPNLNSEGRTAVINYIQRLMALRGANLAQLAERRDAKPDPNSPAQLSYAEGYALSHDGMGNAEAQTQLQQAMTQVEQSRRRVVDEVSSEAADDIDRTPMLAMQRLGDNAMANQAVVDYVNARMRMNGIVQGMRDKMSEAWAAEEGRIDQQTHGGDGKIHWVTLKEQNDDGSDRHVVVVSGTVETLDDGTMVDKEKSSESVVIINEAGEKEMVSPEAILRVDAVEDPGQVKNAASINLMSQMGAAYANMFKRQPAFTPDERYSLFTESGALLPLMAVADEQGKVVNDDGTVNVSRGLGQPVERVPMEMIQLSEDMQAAYQVERLLGIPEQLTLMGMRGQQVQPGTQAPSPAEAAAQASNNATATAAPTPNEEVAQGQPEPAHGSKPDYAMQRSVAWIDADGNEQRGVVSEVVAARDNNGNVVADPGDEVVIEVEHGDGSWHTVEMTRAELDAAVVEYDGVRYNEAAVPAAEEQPLPQQPAATVQDGAQPALPDELPPPTEGAIVDGLQQQPAAEQQEPIVGRSLTADEAKQLISFMETTADVAPEKELTPENWIAEFGEKGIINTPIGEVKQGDNQYFKLAQQGRNGKLGMVKPTLEHPTVIIEDERAANDNASERSTSFVFVKTFAKKDGSRYYYFASITVSKDGKEVVISSQERSANRISKLLQQGKVAWIDSAFSSHPTAQVEESVPLNDSNRPTATDNQSALLGINSPELSASKGSNQGGENQISGQENRGEAGQPQPTALSQIPVDDKDEPQWERATPQLAWDGLVEQAQGDAGLAQQVADGMVENLQGTVKRLGKAKAKGKTPAELMQSAARQKAEAAAAQASLDFWQSVAQEQERRAKAAQAEQRRRAEEMARRQREQEEREKAEWAEAERRERESLRGVPDIVDDTAEAARGRGYRSVNGYRVDRQEPLQGVQGKEIEVKFSDSEMPRGRVAVIDAGQLQPSHRDGMRNPLHFIDEAQPKERKDMASQAAAEKIASRMRPEEITASATAYTGAPTVNTRGEVIQGNNRGAALRLMWESYPEQAALYKQYLIDHAAELGLDAAAIEAMERPVLVNMVDVDDATAIRLGQYVAQDTESGGTQRIDAKTLSQKLGPDGVRSLAAMLLKGNDAEATVSELIEANGVDALDWLHQMGHITDTQYQSALDLSGRSKRVNTEGKNDLRAVLAQHLFQGGGTALAEKFGKLPAKAQRAILATIYRDMDSPATEQMVREVQASVEAYYDLVTDPTYGEQFRKAATFEAARRVVEAWRRTTTISFNSDESVQRSEKYSNFALHLAAMYKGNTQGLIQQTFNQLYDLIQGTQQATLFEQPDNTPRTLAQAIKEVLNIEYDGNTGSNDMGGNPAASAAGERGGTADARGREPSEGGEQPADDRAGTVPTDTERGGQGDLRHTDGRQQDSLDQAEEVDENGIAFVVAPNGTTTFGVVGENSGLTPAPIKLSQGFQNADGKGYGLAHIEANHGEQIRNAGFAGVEEFVSFVATNYDEDNIRVGKRRGGNTPTFLLQVTDKYENTLFIELSNDGTYWNVNSAGVFRKGYSNKKETVAKTEPQQPNNAVSTGSSLSDGDGSGISSSEPNGKPTASASKGSDQGAENQISGQENSEKVEHPEESTENQREKDAGQSAALEQEEQSQGQQPAEGQETEQTAADDTVAPQGQGQEQTAASGYTITPAQYTTKRGKVLDMQLVKFDRELTKDEMRSARELAKSMKGWYDRNEGGFMMRSEEDAQKLADAVMDESGEQLADAAPVSLADTRKAIERMPQESQPASSDQGRQDLTTGSSIDEDAASDAKVRINKSSAKHELNNIIHKYIGKRNTRGFISDLAAALGDTSGKPRQSYYFSFKDASGIEYTLRISNHNVNGENAEGGGKEISIVIKSRRQPNKFVAGNAEITEYVYFKEAIAQGDGQTLALIAQDLSEMLDTGVYADRSGIAVVNTSSGRTDTNHSETTPKSGQKSKPATNPSGNRLVTDERYEELKRRMRAKLGQMNMGIDPEVLAIGTEMAVYHIEKGARKFAEYARAMIADLGDAIRPYLKAFYNGARDLPEVQDGGLADEMTAYDEVRTFDTANFDKGHADPFATAETVVAEQELGRQAEAAKQQIITQRNDERRKEDEQTAADTEAVASQAEVVASQAESDLETARDERQVNAIVEKIDKQVDEVNKQLALLGYYEAEQNAKDYNEAYGYMRNAEKKAVKDANNLAKRLIKDLHIAPATLVDSKGKKLRGYAQANIAPTGGEVTITLPLEQGRELKIYIRLEPTSARRGEDYRVTGLGDNLYIRDIMYRVENPSASGYERYGSNQWMSRDDAADYAHVLQLLRSEAKRYLPAVSTESAVSEKEKPAKQKKAKKNSVSSPMQQSLFDGLFGEEAKQETETHEAGQQKDFEPGDTVRTDVEPINTNENGLQRIDAVRSQGLPADNNRNAGTRSRANDSEKVRQGESRGTDGRAESRNGRTGSEVSQSDGRPGRRVQRLTEPKNTRNNHSERGANHAPTSVDARIAANIKAIELAKQLIENGETATPEQMAVLRKYSGWGGLGKAFNESTPENKRIRELLGEEAYQQAAMSANSSYYTPTYIIDTLWDIAEQMGFEGGNILEGSAGIGNILGQMPGHISERSDIHAIEIDETSGCILSLLYPDAEVDIQGFEKTRIANGSVDLAITNVPFVTGLNVEDTTGDKDLSKKFRNIHDFCIAKNVRKLREGGIGIFISSNGTLDSSKKLRDWVTGEGGADFVGAFRMHNETFGGASVTSDIIVVRKRVNGRKSPYAIDLSTVAGERTADYETGETRKIKGQEIPVVKHLAMDYNRYFIEHPENMAGVMRFGFEEGDKFRPTSKGLFPMRGKNQERMLADFAASFSGKEWTEEVSSTEEAAESTFVADTSADGKKIGELYVKDGKLVVANVGGYYPLEVNANKVKGHTKVECFNAYSAIKEALAAVLDYQTANESDSGLQPLLDRLNKAYDDFVATYGHFNKNTAISFLRNDVDYPNVFSVETFEEKGDGKGGSIQTFGKADVMSKRVVEKEKEPTPTNVKDGIIASVFKYGRIDIPYIAGQLGKSADDVKREIISSGYGFENPVSRQVELSYQYLSGNVREKLRQAQENNENGIYDGNIKALQDVLPMDIPAHLIDFTLGSSWIDPKLYDDYVRERTDIDVRFTSVGGTWFMNAPNYGLNKEKNRAMGVVSEMLHKTVMGHTLIEAAIQNKTITVSESRRKWDGTTETITDKEATQACAAKIDEIRQDFKDWARQRMQEDADMSARMERIYNDTFNNYVPMSIPDDFVPKYFGGASHKYPMHPHQGRAIVRGTMQPLMLAHEVGTGKTFTLISTAMEMRRLGTARKPMIVVQNATVGQFVASAKILYPKAKILTLEEADRSAEGRKNFYAKIRYNDWDMIVVPQSTFEFIPDSEERQMAFIQDKIEEKMLILEKMREADPRQNSIITRQAAKEIEDLREQLAGITEEATKKRTARDVKKEAVTRQNAEVRAKEMLDRRTDDVENFDDMGIDALLIDEAHEYKHLGFATAMQRGVKGVDPSYSKKSQGVYLKTQAVLEKNNGRNVIFATGTPISNTAAEIWTFMRYLMPADTMKEYGIYYFDDFVRNFGNIQQMLEFTTSGKFKENNRFAGYVNLPELVRIWSAVSDTVLTREVGDVRDKIPAIEGGKAQDIYLPQTRALRSIMKYVKKTLEEYEKMSGKEKKENSHIPLTMYGIAKAAAVDARLVQEDAEDDPNSKTNEAVRQTLRSLKETESYKGTVALFADNYQNKHSGFNLYDDIRNKLIAEGVPAEQVVIIRSGMTVKKKLEIFDKVNRGEIRVILGSTFTLGTGVNIQERLHTLIHLDAPNRPMDYTQRNGRILRQGNLHKPMGKPVRILRFGVEDSLDVTAYQRLKTKGAIADSIMNGKEMMANSMTNRVLEEEEDVFGDTVAQLSGSEYAMLKNNAEKNVRKYESRRKQWEMDQTYIHNAKPKFKALIAQAEKTAKEQREYLAKVREAFPDGKFTEIKAGNETFTSVDAMADYFKDHNRGINEASKQIKEGKANPGQTRTLTIQLGGFTFVVQTTLTTETTGGSGQLFSEVHRNMVYSCPALGLSEVPVHQSLLRNAVDDIVNNVITGRDFSERAEAAERSAAHNRSELEQLEKREGVPFEFAKELEEARRQLQEYTEAMRKEMEEKEAKYAAMDANVEAAGNLTIDEDDDVLFRDGDEDIRYRTSSEIDAQYPNWLDGTTTDSGRHTTQVEGTRKTYNKVGTWIEENLGKDVEILDASSGMGYGTQDLRQRGFNIEDVEPYQSEERKHTNPATYSSYGDIAKQYDYIISNAVLNVIPDDWRRNVLHDMAARLKPGGTLFINTRKAGEEKSIKDKIELDSPQEVLVRRNGKIASYQRFFTPGELQQWVREELGDGYTVEIANERNSGTKGLAAVVVKKSDDTRERSGQGAYSDDAVSWASDIAGQLLGEPSRRPGQRREFAARERQRMVERVGELAGKLRLGNVEIVTDTRGLTGRKARAKGWFDPRTGKIVIVIPNHATASDAAATLLHEAVAHYGLRRLFGQHFDTFLDNVYANAVADVRSSIDAIEQRLYEADIDRRTRSKGGGILARAEAVTEAEQKRRNGDYRRTATEEYLAQLAESTDFETAQSQLGGWWLKVKHFFFNMLKKFGITPGFRGVDVSDNELRYVLWCSYRNLQGELKDIFGVARDVAMQYRLGVGNYATQDEVSGVAEPSDGLAAVNERFNQRLSELSSNPNQKDKVLRLGRPGPFLLAAGLENAEIELEYDKIVRKSSQGYKHEHPFDTADLKDLPQAINAPIAVFKDTNGKNDGMTILTEMKKDGRNFIVVVRAQERKRKGGIVLTVNEITTLFPKDARGIVNWINQGKGANIDKAKALDWLEALRNHHGTELNNQELDAATKVVENFENPSTEGENNAELFRDGSPEELERARVRDRYEQRVASGMYQMKEALQYRLGVGNYAAQDEVSGVAEPSAAESMEAANARFNEQLEQWEDGRLPASEYVSVGLPMGILQQFMPNVPIIVRQKVLTKSRKKHELTISDMRNLPKALANPIFVFRSSQETISVLTELTNDKGENIFVAIELGASKQIGHQTIEVNDILTIHGREIENIVNPIVDNNSMVWVDKAKGLNWLSSAKSKSQAIANKVLDAATKVVENFENPSTEGENNAELFRDGSPEELERARVRDRYEQRVASGMYQMKEALQDSMLGLEEFMRAVLGSSKGFRVEDVRGFENAYLGENRLSSLNEKEVAAMTKTLFEPLEKEMARLAKGKQQRDELIDYMMAKHGLERNVYMAERDAQRDFEAYQREHPHGAKTLQDFIDSYRERDYAGLTALTGQEDVADAEAEARRMVADYEARHDTAELWRLTRAANTATLIKQWECGLISDETLEHISEMYQYYIPLRGFDEKTSAEAYGYLPHRESAFNAPIRAARGRRSKADDPIANMQTMAESAIMQGNRNKLVKQRFLNFVLNHPSDLASVSDLWLQYDEAADEWRPVMPDNINDSDPAVDVEWKMAKFEERMKQLAEANPDKYKRGEDAIDIPYRVVESRDLRQHQVLVKRKGRAYVITINGNPRAAQAVNGLTNPDNNISGAIGKKLLSYVGDVNRTLSGLYTTLQPDFVASNFVRDMLYSNIMVWVKESPRYAAYYNLTFLRLNPIKMKRLFAKYRKGTLDMGNRTEYLFKLFLDNGGETGYARMLDIDQHKEKLERTAKGLNRKIPLRQLRNFLATWIGEIGRAIETQSRFAAFITSRHFGRGLDRSIWDAKEISVNFNKKGASGKFLGANGQTLLGNAAAFTSGAGRIIFIFWNAAIQGTFGNFVKNAKRHPVKALAAVAAFYGLGMLIAALGASGGDGDDDDEEHGDYYDLPEHTRRNNIIMRGPGKSWIKIPLPIEFRAVYGMGELCGSTVFHNEPLEAHKLLAQMTQLTPVDVMAGQNLEGGEGFNWMAPLVPSAVKPAYEVGTNRSWTGLPIYKDTPWNKDMPEWTKAYRNANKEIVDLCAWVNEASGGDPYTPGSIDPNPAQIEYLLRGYGGGFWTLTDQLVKLGETAMGKREFDWRYVPLANRVITNGDDRTRWRAVNNEYYRLKEECDKLKARVRHYEDDTARGIFDYAEKIDFIHNSPEYGRYLLYETYRPAIEEYDRAIKGAVDTAEREQLEMEQNQLKKELLEQVRNGGKKKPEPTGEGGEREAS